MRKNEADSRREFAGPRILADLCFAAFHIHHQFCSEKQRNQITLEKVQISREMMTEVKNDCGNRQQVEVLSVLKKMLTLMKAVMMIMLISMRPTVIMVNLMKKKHT